LNVIFDIVVGKMIKGVPQAANFAVHQNLFVGICAAPSRAIAAE
jgi:hypothetical protein